MHLIDRQKANNIMEKNSKIHEKTKFVNNENVLISYPEEVNNNKRKKP